MKGKLMKSESGTHLQMLSSKQVILLHHDSKDQKGGHFSRNNYILSLRELLIDFV